MVYVQAGGDGPVRFPRHADGRPVRLPLWYVTTAHCTARHAVHSWARLHDQIKRSFERINSISETGSHDYATHGNGWFPAVHISCMSQNFRLFHVSNLSVRNFRISLLMYPGSQSRVSAHAARRPASAVLPALRHAVLPVFAPVLAATTRRRKICTRTVRRCCRTS